MTEQFHQRLKRALSLRRDEGLLRELKLSPPCRLNLSANDYLQLRNHPAIMAGAKAALERFGAGSGASPLLSGYFPCHAELLEQLLSWKRKSAGLIFNTGFMANQAVLRCLPCKNDLVLADKFVHHSMIQALTQGEATFKRYNHLDLHHLEELLVKNHGQYETVFVATESVFSMDGDYPDLKRLAELKSKFSFVWILDEAHGTGVFGKTGGGLAEELEVLPEVDILIGTLGKSLASMGAYILTNSSNIVDYLVNFSGEFIYSTFLAPTSAGAASAAIKLVQSSGKKREHLRSISRLLRKQLQDGGWKTDAFDSQIVPIIIGDISKTLDLKNTLLEQGFLVGAVRPPTVPPGSSRIRISLHSGVADKDMDEFFTILNKWKKV